MYLLMSPPPKLETTALNPIVNKEVACSTHIIICLKLRRKTEILPSGRKSPKSPSANLQILVHPSLHFPFASSSRGRTLYQTPKCALGFIPSQLHDNFSFFRYTLSLLYLQDHVVFSTIIL